jgi:ligand-binding sensor domain-containing protein/signal transduction histidine kinase
MLAGMADRPFETITTRQGLPDDALYAVAEDSLGFLWVGTRQGLARFDGYRVHVYAQNAADPGALPDDTVRALLPGPDGAMWVGTSKSGLVRFDARKEVFEPIAGEPSDLATAPVFALAADGAGGVWCAYKFGLAHYKAEGIWEQFHLGDETGFPFKQVFSILSDRAGNLWVGGDDGVALRRAGDAKFTAIAAENDARALGKQHIWALFEDSRGRIWVGSDGDGIGVIEPGSGHIHAVFGLTGPESLIGSATVRGFIEPAPDELWIPTFGNGLITVNFATGLRRRWTDDVSLQAPISNDFVRGIWQSRSGRVFLATERGLGSTDPLADGLLNLHPSPYRKAGLTGKSVFNVMADPDDDIWVGYDDGMIERIDSTGQVRKARPDPALPSELMPKRQVQAIERLADGNIVVASDGLYRIDPRSMIIRPLGDKPALREAWMPTLLVRPDGLWVGTYDGLVHLDARTGRELGHFHHSADDPSSLPDELVTKILAAADGHLWVATRSGLCHFDPEGGTCRTYRHDRADSASLSVNNINGMLGDDQGRLWIATQGGGIDVMEQAGSDDAKTPAHFRRIGHDQGLPDDFVGVMVKGADGRIWMNPPAGLTVIDPTSFQVTQFPVAPGVWQGSSPLKGSTVLSDGTILFPAEDGIIVVRPDRLRPRSNPARLVLSEVSLDRRLSLPTVPIALGQPIILPPEQSGFRAEFSLLDLSAPATTRYAFKLDGFDRDWNDTTADRRSATYTGLDPGSYVLEVRAAADNGRGEEVKIAVPVEVQPAWYQTLIFHMTIVVLGLAGLIAAERARTALLRRRQRMLEAQIEERTASLHKAQNDIQALLDNAEQGFMAVGPDLVVRPLFSAACETLLGGNPQGKSLLDLLYPNDVAHAATQRSIFASVFKDANDFTRGLKLELLAREFVLGERVVQVAYKWLEQSGAVMLVLSDITETRALSAAVERERTRMEMIVLALKESREFLDLAADFRAFLREELVGLIERRADPAVDIDLRRKLHTFKGLLGQFHFFHSPGALHEAEQLLADQPDADGTAVAGKLRRALNLDLVSISDVLGADFLAGGGRISLTAEQITEMKILAAEALVLRPDSLSLARLVRTLEDLSALDVKAALALHSRGALSLADRLGKVLQPVTISGDAVKLPEDRYAPFFRSLVHVFRNAVDHGIETPDERAELDKPEEGSITAQIKAREAVLTLTIADDGRGIDREALANKWLRSGGDPAQAASMTLDDLVFADGLSSRDDATDLSGRGVGMAAVKDELVKLGGSVKLFSEVGRGTTLVFDLPYSKS